jgi:hypothetical protein
MFIAEGLAAGKNIRHGLANLRELSHKAVI